MIMLQKKFQVPSSSRCDKFATMQSDSAFPVVKASGTKQNFCMNLVVFDKGVISWGRVVNWSGLFGSGRVRA